MLDRTFCALRRNSIRLSFQKGAADQGLSHFGGVPDVPEGFEWPCFNTDSIDEPSGDVRLRPLAFLAQFDCEELAKYDRENLLPHTGVLSFFYSIESNRWGFDPEDFGCSRVYWFGNAEELRPAQLPEGLSEAYRFPSLKIEMTAKNSWPDYDDLPQGVDADDYEEFFEEQNMDEEETISKLLGWPNVIQSAMAEECELVTQGFYLGGSEDKIPPKIRREASRNANEKWLLLFQLDTMTDDDFELMFGDDGRLYFWIRKEDLASRRFDRVWLVLQCY